MLLAAKHREVHDKKQMTLCGNAYTIQRILERVNNFLERVIPGNAKTGMAARQFPLLPLSTGRYLVYCFMEYIPLPALRF